MERWRRVAAITRVRPAPAEEAGRPPGITGVAYFSGENPSPLVFFYLWVFLYSAYFFTAEQAVTQIVLVGVVYAVLLLDRPPTSGVPGWWVVGMGTLLVAALVVRVMRDRAELLIARLFDAARTDPLTNLTNRRGFRETLDLELQRSRRSGSPMACWSGISIISSTSTTEPDTTWATPP